MTKAGLKLALLGGGGRLGRVITAAHAHCGGLDALLSHARNGPADITWDAATDPAEALARQLDGLDAVINLIGVTPATAGTGPEDFTGANITAAEAVLTAARLAGVPRVLFASTVAVYGRPAPGQAPFGEDAALSPLSPYAASKAGMEERLLDLAGERDDVSILRIGNVAGADALLSQLMGGTRPTITVDQFASGQGPVRSYISALGLWDALAALTRAASLPRVLNVAHAPAVSMDALLRAWQARRPDDLDWRFQPAPDGAIEYVVTDTARLSGYVSCDLGADPAQRIVDDTIALIGES